MGPKLVIIENEHRSSVASLPQMDNRFLSPETKLDSMQQKVSQLSLSVEQSKKSKYQSQRRIKTRDQVVD